MQTAGPMHDITRNVQGRIGLASNATRQAVTRRHTAAPTSHCVVSPCLLITPNIATVWRLRRAAISTCSLA